MPNNEEIQRRMERRALLLLVVLVTFFFGWMFGIEPLLQARLEESLGYSIYGLPKVVSFAYSIGVAVLFPGGVCVGVYAYAYHHWFIPNRTKLANEQIAKLAEARKAVASAVSYLASFENEMKTKSIEAERLREQVLSLQLLNSENTKDLELKLRAMDSLSRNRIWFERTFAFIIGIASSLAASYVLQVFQAHA